jgi:hypothetical protein
MILEPQYDGLRFKNLGDCKVRHRMISLPMVVLPITEQTLPDHFRHFHYFIA